MEKEFEHKGHTYWVKLDGAIHNVTNESGFIAFVNDEKPGALFWGTVVRDPKGKIMFFKDTLSAFTNANHVKQSEIDSKP